MANSDPSFDPQRFEVHMTADSHFSWVRTRLSIDRTLLAWVRTSISLIGFGFTIVQFFEKFSNMAGVEAAARPEAPRYLGLGLMAVGIASLLISVWQYNITVKHLWGEPFTPLAGIDRDVSRTPTYFVAIALIFVGLFAFIAVFTRAL